MLSKKSLELSDLMQVQRIQSKKKPPQKNNNHMLGVRTFVHAKRLSCAQSLNRAEPGLLQTRLQLGFPFFILANGPSGQEFIRNIPSDITSLSAET